MNRSLLKLQKIREANESLERRRLLREQVAPPPPPAAAPSPAAGITPISSAAPAPAANPNEPKELTKELKNSLEKALNDKTVKICSSFKGDANEKYELKGETYFLLKKGEPNKTLDSWCLKPKED